MMNFLATVVLTTQLTLTGNLNDGLKALDAKKYDAAITSLTKVIEDKDPGNSFRELALHFRAEAYRGKGDKAKALADWTALLKLTRNAEIRETALTGFKESGGDPKQLLPADSPTAVWGKFLAAAQKADLDGALAVSTGVWKELVMKETKGRADRLQREFSREDAPVVTSERIGEKDEAGKAWLELGDKHGRAEITLELTLDVTSNSWLISSYRENRNGDRSSPPAASNMNRLKQIGVALHMWAVDNGNKLPEKLATLKGSYIQGEDILLWVNPQKPEEKRPFEYCPGLNLSTPGATTLLAAAPVAVNGQREVLYLDGHVITMKEEEFMKAAKEQKWAVAGAWKKEDLSKEKQEEIRQLIQQLGHAEFKVRKDARAKLQTMGGAITPVLEEYRNATDPEIRATVRELLGEK